MMKFIVPNWILLLWIKYIPIKTKSINSNLYIHFKPEIRTADIMERNANKIIAFISGSGYNTQNGGQCAVTLFRGATNLCPSAFMNVYAGSSITVSANTFHYVDSPATTSSTTYTVYFQNSNGSTTVTFNAGGVSNNAIATLLLMEIKA